MLHGRVIVVSGGGRGLGREMALALSEAGADVVITAARSDDELASTVDAARALRGRMVSVQADVCSAVDCDRVMQTTLDAFGDVHGLVNNAGRGMRLISETFTSEPTRFWETPGEAWRKIIDINVNGPFNMARALVPHMVERGFGRIVNISTSLVTMARRGYSPYGPSKAALEAFSRSWAQDLQGTGVTVNVLLPGGASDTALLPDMPNRRGADGQLLSPALMRAPVVWLCSDHSAGHTGGRYIAREWDPALPAAQAASAARQPAAELPSIM